jgi:hypothetical protein
MELYPFPQKLFVVNEKLFLKSREYKVAVLVYITIYALKPFPTSHTHSIFSEALLYLGVFWCVLQNLFFCSVILSKWFISWSVLMVCFVIIVFLVLPCAQLKMVYPSSPLQFSSISSLPILFYLCASTLIL